MHLTLPDRSTLSLDRPVIVGILNVTPDSFSDGGSWTDLGCAVDHAKRMADEGADVLDIGGESTRPGAGRISEEEQIRRVVPVVDRVRRAVKVPLSVDSTRASVARAALDSGASILNDVSAGRDDPAMFTLAAERGAPLILMHMLGEPATMQQAPAYGDVVEEVLAFLHERIAEAMRHGVPREQIVIDPGLGFGKTFDHNLTLLSNLDLFVATAHPVMLGASRKKFLGTITGEDDPANRDGATAATTALAVAAGVTLLRVHDVKVNRHAADVAFAIRAS